MINDPVRVEGPTVPPPAEYNTMNVKICGITREHDALAAESLGAAAVGFVFYRKSPRYVEPRRVREIASALGPFIGRVGVFVDASQDEILTVAEEGRLTAVQLHGRETPAICHAVRDYPVIKAFATREDFSPKTLEMYNTAAFLLDASVTGAHGGTGVTCDWNIAAECALRHRIILAGGLGPENIVQAVTTVRPWGVDCSSGVEDSPGKKNHELLHALFEELKRGNIL